MARELLKTDTDPALVTAVLRNGSPRFPRRHADPEDYLRRTLRSAALFSRAPYRRLSDLFPPRAPCVHSPAGLRAAWGYRFCLRVRVSYPSGGSETTPDCIHLKLRHAATALTADVQKATFPDAR